MKKTLSLAFETSGRTGSVAIGIGGEILAETVFSGQLRHSAELFSTTKAMLDEINRKPDEIENIYCVIGPGSFTGIRISVTTAKMFALSTQAKIFPVNTMDALAENASDYENDNNTQISRIATVIDAKRGSFFIAGYEKQADKWEKVFPDKLTNPKDFLAEFCENDSKIWLLGEGLTYYSDSFCRDNVKFLPEQYWPGRAKNVFLMGHRNSQQNPPSDPVNLVPFYLRGHDAKPKKGLKI